MSSYLRGPHDPYTPPSYLLRFINQFDSGRMRIRWSQRAQQWHVERKEACRIEYIKSLPRYVKGAPNDSWIRARDGYILVDTFAPVPHLGDRTISALRFADPWRLGAKALELELIRQEEKKETTQTRDFHNHIESIAKEEFQYMIWRGGERSAVPSNYQGVA